MGNVVMIAGSETLLGRKLVEKELDRGNRVIAPVNSKKDSSTGESSRENLMVFSWNRSSLISTKTLIREAQRKWRSIDRALILGGPFNDGLPFGDHTLSELDERIDQEIKGLLYLTRELSLLFSGSPSLLAFVRNDGSRHESGTLEKGCAGFFKSFSDSLIEEKSENIYKCGFINGASNVEVCADFILRTMDEQPDKARGEWLRISDRKSLFSGLPIEKRS